MYKNSPDEKYGEVAFLSELFDAHWKVEAFLLDSECEYSPGKHIPVRLELQFPCELPFSRASFSTITYQHDPAKDYDALLSFAWQVQSDDTDDFAELTLFLYFVKNGEQWLPDGAVLMYSDMTMWLPLTYRYNPDWMLEF